MRWTSGIVNRTRCATSEPTPAPAPVIRPTPVATPVDDPAPQTCVDAAEDIPGLCRGLLLGQEADLNVDDAGACCELMSSMNDRRCFCQAEVMDSLEQLADPLLLVGGTRVAELRREEPDHACAPSCAGPNIPSPPPPNAPPQPAEPSPPPPGPRLLRRHPARRLPRGTVTSATEGARLTAAVALPSESAESTSTVAPSPPLLPRGRPGPPPSPSPSGARGLPSSAPRPPPPSPPAKSTAVTSELPSGAPDAPISAEPAAAKPAAAESTAVAAARAAGAVAESTSARTRRAFSAAARSTSSPSAPSPRRRGSLRSRRGSRTPLRVEPVSRAAEQAGRECQPLGESSDADDCCEI